MTARSKRQVFSQLDLMKLLMAVLVVAIHTEPIGIVRGSFLHELYDDILRLAVPFFFMTSGYLLGSKYQADPSAGRNRLLGRSAVRNLRLYLLWSLIYLPAAVVGYVMDGKSLTSAAVSYAANLVLVGEHFYSWPLWYLLALIYALAGMIVLRWLGSRGICAAALVLFYLAHAIDAVYTGTPLSDPAGVLLGQLTDPMITGGPARILTGMFYVSCGWLLAEKPLRIPHPVLLATFAVTLALSAWLGWWPVSLVSHVCFFALVMKLKVSLPGKMGPILRRSSTVIYFTHMLFFFAWFLLHDWQEEKGVAGFAWTLAWSLAACVLVVLAERRWPRQRITHTLF